MSSPAAVAGGPVAVCVFAKPPVPGQVKTRLAAAVGPEAAASLAFAFLRDTWTQVAALPWARPILSSTAVPSPSVLDALGVRADEVWLQDPGDLGARVEGTLMRALARHPFAIALGADCPGLPCRFLQAARDALLAGAPSVLGPTDDGGFYLLGLSRCPAGLLGGLPWSCAGTYRATRDRLRERGLIAHAVAPWFDVDDLDDLRRLARLLAASQISAPRTLACMQALRLAPDLGLGAAKSAPTRSE